MHFGCQLPFLSKGVRGKCSIRQRCPLSNSGRQKGQHIIDPRSVDVGAVKGRLAAWSVAPDAIAADASSTAFMMLSDEEINEYCLANAKTAAIIMPHADSVGFSSQTVRCFGELDEIELEV